MSTVKYEGVMDKECIAICNAMNLLPGIETFQSCCGHGNRPYWIFFTSKTVKTLRPLLVEIYERKGWSIWAQWANGGDAIYFCLEGPQGAYKEAKQIARGLHAG